jgi:hypothetical protein
MNLLFILDAVVRPQRTPFELIMFLFIECLKLRGTPFTVNTKIAVFINLFYSSVGFGRPFPNGKRHATNISSLHYNVRLFAGAL